MREGGGEVGRLMELDAHPPAAPYLLQPDHTYTIELIAAGGRAIYRRDGEVIFDYTDPAPLTRGWFGFRTVNSATRISSFEVHRLAKTP